jgi:hypothetical protein
VLKKPAKGSTNHQSCSQAMRVAHLNCVSRRKELNGFCSLKATHLIGSSISDPSLKNKNKMTFVFCLCKHNFFGGVVEEGKMLNTSL